ncbi:MAG TPA: tripartite tricarboxylate transporter substrate binding protein [Xanthobacteraceae bacterium]|nr:tripartite tricarboxylate transporter substrate binding protein [Xanthobacteraceae bacterium]
MHLVHRRTFLFGVVSTAFSFFARRIAWALDYPTRPVRIIVGFAAGGATDIIARLVGQGLSERLGQSFVVENRPGAGTNIATEAVISAPADGYTLLFVGPPAAINATLYDKLDFNFIRGIAPVATIVRVPFVIVVNTSFPAKTVPELVDYAKANPGKISMGVPGKGSGPHMAGELFKAMAGINMVTVQYRGDAPALSDLMGGQIQLCFNSLPAAMELITEHKVRALATTATTRSNTLPNLPTVAEFVDGYEASAFYGIGAPKNTPSAIVDKLSLAINSTIADHSIQTRLTSLGGTVLTLSPSEFEKLITAETDKWAKVIRLANIKLD